jgi:hypothetical protein
MSQSSRWPPGRSDFERLICALGYDQIARLYGVSVSDVFDLERKYKLDRRSMDEDIVRENNETP